MPLTVQEPALHDAIRYTCYQPYGPIYPQDPGLCSTEAGGAIDWHDRQTYCVKCTGCTANRKERRGSTC